MTEKAPLLDSNPPAYASELQAENIHEGPSGGENPFQMDVMLQKGFSHVRGHHSDITLRWSGLSMSVAEKTGTRMILNDVSGHIKTGQLCSIMGPSGAGKSTLLNILAGRIAVGGKVSVEGEIDINGRAIESTSFRERLAYVMQEDALFATSTPREAITFSARLRLSRDVGFAEQDELVEDMIHSLGLEKCADTMIGGGLIKGISGGEKKRTAIGLELVTQPSLLFLDEPTTGLDSYAAFKLCQVLRNLAAAGCAVLCTIHQPSSEIHHLFDCSLLLGEGRIVYGGPTTLLPKYFQEEYGKQCPRNYNPADFAMFILQKESPEVIRGLGEKWAKRQEASGDGALAKSLGGSQARELSARGETRVVRAKASLCTQLSYLAGRERKHITRDRQGLGARFGMTLFLNGLFGLIFYQVGRGGDLDSHLGALFQVVISAMMGSAQPMILTFPLERPIFLREYATGTYGALPYLVSKLMVEVPLQLIQTSLAFLVVHTMVGFQGSLPLMILVTALFGVVAASTALLLGSLASNVTAATQAAPMIFVPQMLFAGFFVPTSQMPSALRWLQYLCPLKFAMNLELILEFQHDPIARRTKIEGNDIEVEKWWLYLSILVALFLLFRLGSVFLLRLRARDFK